MKAEVAELADAPDSKSGALAGVRVRLPPSAPAGGDDFLRRRVAQLAERCLDMAEVTGSNPVAPTTFRKKPLSLVDRRSGQTRMPLERQHEETLTLRIVGPPATRIPTSGHVQQSLGTPMGRQARLAAEIPDISIPLARNGNSGMTMMFSPPQRGDGRRGHRSGSRGGGGSGNRRKIFFCGGIRRYNCEIPSRISHSLILNSRGGEI